MDEAAGMAVMLAVTAALVPAVVNMCDRTLARRRLPDRAARVPRRGGRVAPATARQPRRARTGHAGTATTAEWFDTIARGVRAGLPAVDAVLAAAPPSAAAAGFLRGLAAGQPLHGALSSPDPAVAALGDCMHGGSLSPAALDMAASSARADGELRGEVRVAVSYARQSARFLTVLPFALLVLAALLSGTARSGLSAPGPLACIVAGAVANIAGARWMHRIISSAVRPVPSDAMASVAESIAAHVTAGGTVTSALDALSQRHEPCAESGRLMRAGLPLEDAVRPIAVAGPGVARTIVQAHHDGLPLAPALRRLAAEMRTRRRDELLAAIRAIPARATVPLVLCVLPSFVLTAVVPLGLASFGAVRTPAA